MNKYVRNLLGIVFQIQPTQQAVRTDPQSSLRYAEEWRKLWQSQGQPWRTEPEIDAKRQEELSQRRAIISDVEKGIYPFKGMKLSRADVEWLLATLDGNGPVDWSDPNQRNREGLDLRGADLRWVNLRQLPLARLRGALTWKEQPWKEQPYFTKERRQEALVLLEGADLKFAHLEGSTLAAVHLEHADLRGVHLEYAYLIRTHLEGTSLVDAHLERANLTGAYLEDTYLVGVILADEKHIGPRLLDTHWGNSNLGMVNWEQVRLLDDEVRARQKELNGKRKDRTTRIYEYEKAICANRQLAIALQNQGLNEDAARFAYCAQVLQRELLGKQKEYGRWLFSALLALLAGYGYRMWRILAAYLIIVSTCAAAYFIIGIYHPPHLTLLQAFLESVTAFHGRVFYELFTPDTPQIWVTAFEAIAGLVIESVFIAMLTQRFFGK